MMPNKRLLGLVPEAKKYMMQKVIFSWMSLLAGIIMWFCVGEQIEAVKDGSGVLLSSLLLAGGCICFRYAFAKLISDSTQKAVASVKTKLRGDLIAVITGDIELLEVFYAHTIAPVCIAFIVSVMMTFVIGSFHPAAGLLAANSYALIGIALPILTSHMGREAGRKARNRLGGLNNVFLESLRGIREVLQFGQGEIRRRDIEEKTAALNEVQAGIRSHEGTTGAAAGALVMALPILMLLLGIAFKLPFPALVMTTISLAASFGPVLALANLSAAMDQTLAAGERVLALLEEEPETPDVTEGERPSFSEAALFDVTFSYDRELILKDLTAAFPGGTITAVTGPSGVGKSTLLKLLMRFWEADAGAVQVSGVEVGRIETAHLRSLESYMTQDTDLFNVSIRDNIRIGRLDASDAEAEEAAKKASIHDFIMTLPEGYDTKTGELGERLSGGERQRIGLARAFLHGAPLLLLDEPTSNLDSLNEGVILKALRAEAKESGRTVVLISHRASTSAVADRAYAME